MFYYYYYYILHAWIQRQWKLFTYKYRYTSNRFADRSLIHYEHMLLFGDLNFDMLNSDKSATLNDFCDILNLSQLVNGPTCFKKGCIPSLVDVIMTNKKSLF